MWPSFGSNTLVFQICLKAGLQQLRSMVSIQRINRDFFYLTVLQTSLSIKKKRSGEALLLSLWTNSTIAGTQLQFCTNSLNASHLTIVDKITLRNKSGVWRGSWDQRQHLAIVIQNSTVVRFFKPFSFSKIPSIPPNGRALLWLPASLVSYDSSTTSDSSGKGVSN